MKRDKNGKILKLAKKKCLQCGKEFQPRYSKIRFCSQKCARLYMKANKIGFWAKGAI